MSDIRVMTRDELNSTLQKDNEQEVDLEKNEEHETKKEETEKEEAIMMELDINPNLLPSTSSSPLSFSPAPSPSPSPSPSPPPPYSPSPSPSPSPAPALSPASAPSPSSFSSPSPSHASASSASSPSLVDIGASTSTPHNSDTSNNCSKTKECKWCRHFFENVIEVECDSKHTYCKHCFSTARQDLKEICPGTKQDRCYRKLTPDLISLRLPFSSSIIRQSNVPPSSPLEIPLVGAKTSLIDLQAEYASEVIKNKITMLGEKYEMIFYRPIRGDGNCFYRALAVQIFENDASMAHFHQFLISTPLEGLNSKKVIQYIIELKEKKNDQELSEYIVRLLRGLTAYNLNKNKSYGNYFVSKEAWMDRCKLANKMGEEAEHLEISALLSLLGMSCKLYQLDRVVGPIQTYVLPEETETPMCHLLYRPGHYDILYKY